VKKATISRIIPNVARKALRAILPTGAAKTIQWSREFYFGRLHHPEIGLEVTIGCFKGGCSAHRTSNHDSLHLVTSSGSGLVDGYARC
jgi:hypothetical protein